MRAVPIEVDRSPRRRWFRAGEYVDVRVGGPVADQETGDVRDPGPPPVGRRASTATCCGSSDGPLAFELSGRCAYQSTFEYSSEA